MILAVKHFLHGRGLARSLHSTLVFIVKTVLGVIKCIFVCDEFGYDGVLVVYDYDARLLIESGSIFVIRLFGKIEEGVGLFNCIQILRHVVLFPPGISGF